MLVLVAFRNLFRNPRRTLAIVLTVAFGTSALLLFDGFNNGVMNEYRDNTIHAHYGHGQINTKGYLDKVYEKPWEHWIDNWDEVETYIKSLNGVDYVFPRMNFFALLTNGDITVSGLGQGVDAQAEAEFFYSMNIEEGEMLKDQPDGIILGKGLARSLDIKPGDTITVLSNTIYGTINGVDLTVTGIFHTGSREFDDRIFRIPLKEAQTLMDTDLIESVSIGLAELDDWNHVAGAITAQYGQLEVTPFAVLDKVYYQHAVDWLNSQFDFILTIIVTIVLLGIMNTTSTAILERKQEIGNLRANGESVGDIMRLLAWEGLALGLFGAIAGVAVALVLDATLLNDGILMPPAPGLTRQFQVGIEIQPHMIFMTILMGTVTALAATLLAGQKVARMPIGDALRSL